MSEPYGFHEKMKPAGHQTTAFEKANAKAKALSIKHLPRYEADAGAFTATEFNQIKQSVPMARGGVVRSMLLPLMAGPKNNP